MKKLIPLIFFSLFSINLFATDSIKFGTDIRAKWKSIGTESHMKLEYNGLCHYQNDNSWIDTKIKVEHSDAANATPIASVSLDRFLIGYQLNPELVSNTFIEVGRDKLESLFDSKIQYKSHFHGMHLSFQQGALRIHGGPHIVDSTKKHVGAVVEAVYSGLPVTLTQSITHWAPNADYTISETSAKYQVTQLGSQPVVAYAAILRNLQYTSHNNAACIGATLGSITKKADYMLDVNFQYASDYAIPAFDFNGVGLGSRCQVKAAYAITDNFSMQGKVGFASKMLTEISAIYAW